jgi:hypothetical protein
MVTNLAVRLSVTLRSTLTVYTATTASVEATICSGILSALSRAFVNAPDYMRRPETLSRRVLCKYIPPPLSHSSNKPMVILMVQVETADRDNSVLNSISSLFIYNTTSVFSLMDVNLIEPTQAAFGVVSDNTEKICPSGKTPTDTRISCYCAPGYYSYGEACIGCDAGNFKAFAGPGSCIRCPVGSTSKAASSMCTSLLLSLLAVSNSTDSSNNIPIIAGGVVGGVVLVALLIFGVFKAFYS